MPTREQSHSSTLRRLQASAGRAGLHETEQDALVGAVLRELAVRLTPLEWREICGWLPWDVQALAGPRHAERTAPKESIVVAVTVTAGLPRPVVVAAVRNVLSDLADMLPPMAIPPCLTTGVPGV